MRCLALAHWRIHWCIGALVHWSRRIGALVHWCIGASLHRCIGVSVLGHLYGGGARRVALDDEHGIRIGNIHCTATLEVLRL